MNLRCLDEKSNQKNKAKNILPLHYLAHARIFGNPSHLYNIARFLNKAWLVHSQKAGFVGAFFLFLFWASKPTVS